MHKTLVATALALILASTASTAKAAFIFNFLQVGSDVVLTGSGTVNTGGMHLVTSFPSLPQINPSTALSAGGPTSATNVGVYTVTLTGPANFGTGGTQSPSSGSGDPVTFGPAQTEAFLPVGYVSGSPLANSDTYSGKTFASLGLTPGTYTWTFGAAANADSITVNVGPTPEPASLALLALGALALPRHRRPSR